MSALVFAKVVTVQRHPWQKWLTAPKSRLRASRSTPCLVQCERQVVQPPGARSGTGSASDRAHEDGARPVPLVA